MSKQELITVTEFAALRRTLDEVLRVGDWGFGWNYRDWKLNVETVIQIYAPKLELQFKA